MNSTPQRARPRSGARAPFPGILALPIAVLAAAYSRSEPPEALVLSAPASYAHASHAVQIHDFAFDPAEIAAAVGDTVVFTNGDAFVHSVTDDRRAWDSAGIRSKRSWSLVVTGPLSYHCSFHPSMRGSILVH